jgi:serine/threonine-protein kinase RsbW
MLGKKNSIELHIPSELGYEKVAMKAGEAVANLLGFVPDRIEDLKTAISEAVINAIEHGNKLNKDLSVVVFMTATTGKLEIEVHDKGKGAASKKRTIPDIDAKIEGEIPARGLGMFLIEQLVDEVEFVQDSAEGSYIKMVVHLEGKK